MTTIAMVDLDKIPEIYKKVKKEYSQYGKKILATCMYSDDPDLDLEIELKLSPYGGFIVIDNSSLATYFKNLKVMCLHAILQGARCFVYEYS